MLLALIVGAQLKTNPINIAPPPPRFELTAPCPSLSGVMLDGYNDGMGLAQQRARAEHLQARILWVDGTANLERVNTTAKIQKLMAKVADVGFNTVVFDIKPISGQVLYKSNIAPKIEEWRGQKLPKDFDPLPVMIHEAHLRKLQLLVSMNAFSEGHTLMKVGPGYGKPDQQSVLYDAVPQVIFGDRAAMDVASKSSVQDSDGKLHLFTDAVKLKVAEDSVVVVVSKSGAIVSTLNAQNPKIPSGGFLVEGSGDAADFLKQHAISGSLKVDSRPEYVKTADHPDQYPLMMNPNNPDVRDYALSIIKEVVSNYAVDGVLYDDRLRFAGMNADFSEDSQSQFESYIHRKISWPDDVFKITFDRNLKKGLRPGPYYDAWMLWRSLQMRNWIAEVRSVIKHTRNQALFGIYAGSWYGEYPKFGSNYGGSNLEAGFSFLTPQYEKTGFANLLDLLITGCYYTVPTIYDAMSDGASTGSTVEAAGQLTNRVVDDQCWAYAGIDLETFGGNADALANAIQAACGSTQGVMVFDLSHNIEPMWPVFKCAFQFAARAPHAVPGLLTKVRDLRARYRKLGARERPVVISAGSSGAGF